MFLETTISDNILETNSINASEFFEKSKTHPTNKDIPMVEKTPDTTDKIFFNNTFALDSPRISA